MFIIISSSRSFLSFNPLFFKYNVYLISFSRLFRNLFIESSFSDSFKVGIRGELSAGQSDKFTYYID